MRTKKEEMEDPNSCWNKAKDDEPVFILLGRPVRLIAFIGKAGSGKTTAAKYIASKYLYCRVRFADGLKKMLIDGLGIDVEYIDGSKKEEPCEQLCGVTARHAMITLGTEWGRDLIHPDIWVQALSRQVVHHIAMGVDRFVIDDVRFLNEGKWVKQFSHVETRLVRLLRYMKNDIQHQSETEQDQIEADEVIYNNGPIESLYTKLDNLIDSFKKE